MNYLMCSKCKKKIRKLTPGDRETMIIGGIVPLPEKLKKLIK